MTNISLETVLEYETCDVCGGTGIEYEGSSVDVCWQCNGAKKFRIGEEPELEKVMKERDAFVAKLNTRIAALEADNKAARDAAAGSFARAEAAEAKVEKLTEALCAIAETSNYTRASWMQDTARTALEATK